MVTLTQKSYDLLKSVDLSEMGDSVRFDDATLSFETDDIQLLQIILNEEIVTTGLDEEYNPTDHGRDLYVLYDEILYQTR